MERMISQADLDKIRADGKGPAAPTKRAEDIVKLLDEKGAVFEVKRRNAVDLVQNLGFRYADDVLGQTEEDVAAAAPRKRRPRGEKLAASRKLDEERAKKAKPEGKAVSNSKSKGKKKEEEVEEKTDLDTSALDNEEKVVAFDLQNDFDELEAEEAAREAKNSGNV